MRYRAAMYVETVPNRGSPPAILLRESYREGKSVRKRTLLNLSNWSAEHIEGLRGVLKGGIVVPAGREAFAVQRSTLAPARPRRRRVGHGPRYRPGPVARPQEQARAQPAARSGAGDDRQPHHRAGLQAGDRQSARSGHRGLEPGRRTWPGRGGRERTLRGARLVAR